MFITALNEHLYNLNLGQFYFKTLKILLNAGPRNCGIEESIPTELTF